MAAVELKGVVKTFGETWALRDAALAAMPGEIHAIVGENGSGKSTLAKIISGAIRADSGHVDVLGIEPRTPAEAIAVGVATIYQEILVADELAVWENVFAGTDGLWRRALPTDQKRRATAATLQRLAQEPVDPDARVATLPLHLKQWVVIARAILRKPRLLIVDESSAALDLDATGRLHKEMLALKETGACILLVTHRIRELVRIADAATILRDGVTVGRLSRGAITEERILRLMSAVSGQSARPPAELRRRPISLEPIIQANGIRLAKDAAAFDFTVHPGEIVGLAGLDGAGHGAFLQILVGIERPFSGEVRVRTAAGENHAINRPADAEAVGIAYVSGDRKKEGVFPNLSILENFGLALHARFAGPGGLIDRAGLKAAFARESERLGIRYGRPADRITTLSGGNQQKVLIARAFALAPAVILLNDPARGVDIGTKQDLYEQLRAFAAAGGAVVYLSSELEEFFNFAHRADVFFGTTRFASFPATEIDEEHLLAAMFGRRGHVAFDEDLAPDEHAKAGTA